MAERMRGGCACGKVRFTANVAIAFKNILKSDVTWESEPAWYHSSPIARRPYCAACGTSLGFEFPDSEKMDLTVAAFDDPARFRPIHHFGAESLHRNWLNTEGLPEYRTEEHQPLVDRWLQAVGKMPD